jgi:hypothetical protein
VWFVTRVVAPSPAASRSNSRCTTRNWRIRRCGRRLSRRCCATQPAKRIRAPTAAPSHGKRPALLGECDGFQVHAATNVPPNTPDQLERLLPEPPDATPTRPVAPNRPKQMRRAELLQRVFLTGILACPCAGRLRLIAVITQPDVIEAVAAAIILSHQLPARAPPPTRRAATR